LILPPLLQEENYPVEEIQYVEEALSGSVGNIKISFFPSHIPGNDNESSLCILFDTENCDILVTGDRSWFGEKSLLKQYAIPKVDVLIAGHHGSDQSTSEYLLQAVCPEIVCISAGKDNVYGHPNPELLERLESFGCTVYRTDLQGDIIIRR
jgi:competence protein ComEC